MPMPETSSASVSSTQLVFSEPLTATQVKPAVSRASPVTITGRRPVLSDRAPASGEMIHRHAEERQQPQAGRHR